MPNDQVASAVSPADAVNWLREAAVYFARRETRGEDAAHWANVSNAETAIKVAALIGRLVEKNQEPKAAPRMISLSPIISDEHLREVCRPGTGPTMCRFVMLLGSGWNCMKHTFLAAKINERVEDGRSNARGDNCEGRMW